MSADRAMRTHERRDEKREIMLDETIFLSEKIYILQMQSQKDKSVVASERNEIKGKINIPRSALRTLQMSR